MTYKEVKNVAKYVPVSELTLLENNPRTISKEAFEKLKKSVGDFSDYFEGRPCLANEVDGKKTIFAGNQRFRAAVALGWTEVPCVIYKDLPPEEQQRLTVKDNIQLGDWDFDILANEFDIEMLEEEGLDGVMPDLSVLDDIQGNEDRTPADNLRKVVCPECGKEFEI